MLEIIIDNRDGNLWNLSGIAADIVYKTARIGRASSFELTLVRGGWYEDQTFRFNVGDVIRVQRDGLNVFLGYIFVIDSGRDEAVKITAYDQLRYLLTKETYVFTNKTVGEVILLIAEDAKLKVGFLENTGYQIPSMIEDSRPLLDMICNALQMTLLATGRNYALYDDYGALTLRRIEDMALDFSIGDVSLLFDYQSKETIEDSYNMVKIVQDNPKAGIRDAYIYQDSANIARWGQLKYHQVANENMNRAQIEEMLKSFTQLKNRVGRKFRVESIGDIRVRAGSFISVNIGELGMNQNFMVEACTHNIDGDDHTMTLDLVDIRLGDAVF